MIFVKTTSVHCRGEDPPKMTFDGKDIEVSEKMESLGVILNKGGVGYGHLTKIKNKLASMRTLVSRNYRIRTQAILERLYTTYLVPQINYCSQQYDTNMDSHLREVETEIRKFLKLSQTKIRPLKIMGLKEQLIYNDLKQLHKIRHGKSAIEFADFFTITSLQMRTNEEIEKKKFNHSFTQYMFGRRVQKYWNLLPLETRNLGIEGFKAEVKAIMIDKNWARLRQKLLNFGLSQPIELPPAGINEK